MTQPEAESPASPRRSSSLPATRRVPSVGTAPAPLGCEQRFAQTRARRAHRGYSARALPATLLARARAHGRPAHRPPGVFHGNRLHHEAQLAVISDAESIQNSSLTRPSRPSTRTTCPPRTSSRWTPGCRTQKPATGSSGQKACAGGSAIHITSSRDARKGPRRSSIRSNRLVSSPHATSNSRPAGNKAADPDHAAEQRYSQFRGRAS